MNSRGPPSDLKGHQSLGPRPGGGTRGERNVQAWTAPATGSDHDPDCYMEATNSAPRRRRMSQATQLRNWNDLVTDNGLVQLESGSWARGDGNQCFFLAHALAVDPEGDLRGTEREPTIYLEGLAQRDKEDLIQALATVQDKEDYFREGKYGGGLTVGRTSA